MCSAGGGAGSRAQFRGEVRAAPIFELSRYYSNTSCAPSWATSRFLVVGPAQWGQPTEWRIRVVRRLAAQLHL